MYIYVIYIYYIYIYILYIYYIYIYTYIYIYIYIIYILSVLQLRNLQLLGQTKLAFFELPASPGSNMGKLLANLGCEVSWILYCVETLSVIFVFS